jgi:predicted enzyme related to lactoylglutathione lyase
MSSIDNYPAGAHCWVDTFQPDPESAARFYGALFGWSFEDPIPMPTGLSGEYRVARLGGRMVAGVGQAPQGWPAVWTTYIRVEDVSRTVAQATAAGGAALVGPIEAGRDGRLAVLSDPAGVALGLWQPGDRPGAQRVNEPGTWTMSALHTPALDEAGAFYGELFGWKLDRLADAPLAYWRLPGHVGGQANQGMPRDVVAVAAAIGEDEPTPPHWSISFLVAGCDDTVSKARELGGTVLLAPTDGAGFRSAALADPQGGVIAISQRKPTS